MKKIEFEKLKEYFENQGMECPVRKWEYDLDEEELKKKDFQKWWYLYNWENFLKEVEKEEKAGKMRRVKADYKKFREKTGLHPQNYFENLYRDKLIEIINLDEYKNDWPWGECYEKYGKIDEENCEWLREAENQDIAAEIIEGKSSDELLRLLNKVL